MNNAGVFLYKPFLQTLPSEWDRVVATNLGGAFNFSRAVLPGMIARRTGRIVNVSSIHGLHGDANLTAHCAAKFGLIGLTQALAREVRKANVTVNAVCPGTTDNRTPDTELSPRSTPLLRQAAAPGCRRGGRLALHRRGVWNHGRRDRGLRRDAPDNSAVTRAAEQAAEPLEHPPRDQRRAFRIRMIAVGGKPRRVPGDQVGDRNGPRAVSQRRAVRSARSNPE